LFLGLSSEEYSSLKEDPKRVADLLARKIRDECKADLGLAMFEKSIRPETEIVEKDYQVKTYYSLLTPPGIENQECSIGGEFWMVRERASIIALDMLRKYLARKYT
jgi:hypothetical protein